MLSEKDALMWLTCVKGITRHRLDVLMERYGSAAALSGIGEAQLVRDGINPELAREMYSVDPEAAVAGVMTEMEKTHMEFIPAISDAFPGRLRDIPDCPIGLFVRGRLPEDSMPALAVVGSRRCTHYGANAAYDIAKEMASRGAAVISGMADGIDSMAHKGALDGEGYTLAVLGCGADVCYPSGNRELMERILAKGCVVSELPPGTRPSKFTFPARNRIISGLADVVTVMEADERSGTLITVSHAIDQDRDVMALPGNITSRLSRGTNRLIGEGALVITRVEDVAHALGLSPDMKNKKLKISEKTDIPLESEEKLVYDCIHSEPVTVDEILARSGVGLARVQYALTMLELKGIVKRLAGQKYEALK